MEKTKYFWTIVVVSLLLASCASGPKTIPIEDYDENSTAHGAAYVSDAMHIRGPMPSQGDWRQTPFYYKHCSEVGPRFYYSKTSYECSSPP